MVRDGRKHLVLRIHKVTDVIDGGEFVARSHRIPIPGGINAAGMHRIAWPKMGVFIRREVAGLLDTANTAAFSAPLVLQDEPAEYRKPTDGGWEARIDI